MYEKTWQHQARLATQAPETKSVCGTFAVEVENTIKALPVIDETTQEGSNKIQEYLMTLKNLSEKHKVTQSVQQDKTKLARNFFNQASITLGNIRDTFLQSRKTGYSLREGVSFVNELAQQAKKYSHQFKRQDNIQASEAFDQFHRFATDLVTEINKKTLTQNDVYDKMIRLDQAAKKSQKDVKALPEPTQLFDKIINAVATKLNKWFPSVGKSS